MKLETVEVPDVGAGVDAATRMHARKQFLIYREAMREGRNAEQRKADEIVMKGYREIAKGRAVLDLRAVMRGAGIREDDWYPKLAICRADAAVCSVELSDDGSARFIAGEPPRVGRPAKARRVDLPRGTFPAYRLNYNMGTHQAHTSVERNPWRWKHTAQAVVPTVPPQYRPGRGLGGYHLLWEAIWTPVPPVDPMLLKHLGGGVYAVLAQWDLSPLERAVLGGRL